MSRRVLLIATLIPFHVTGCSNSSATLNDAGLTVIGDERGGTIANSVGSARQPSALQLVTAHCGKFSKKGFITKMDFESGLLTFQCILQKTPL